MRVDFDNCSNKLIEVEEKCQETQKMCVKLLKQCKMKDNEIESIGMKLEELQRKRQLNG